MKPDVLVIGGGCAGLAAATALSEGGARVVVLEARTSAGGRSRSWIDPRTGDVEDNGQHLVLGCYEAFLAFARRTGGVADLRFETSLEILLVGRGGDEARFRPAAAPPPFDLLGGLLRLGGFPLRSALAARGLVREALSGAARGTAAGWLAAHGQAARARERLWDPLILATLNARPEDAAAPLFSEVLRRALLGGPEAFRVGFAGRGLSALVVEPAAAYLGARGGAVRTRTRVVHLETDARSRFVAARCRDGSRIEAGAAVLAAPPREAAALLPPGSGAFGPRAAAALGSSPIVSVHVWFDRAILPRRMVGLLASPLHWVFDRAAIGGAGSPGHVTAVASAADPLVGRDRGSIASLAIEELRARFPRAREAAVLRWRVLKEREATPRLGPAAEALRPGGATALPNLVLAGGWTATGLPATLESAAASGHRAAELLGGNR